MKITSLEIERFGTWTGLNLDKFSDGINVFYGANEAGKSTLMEFIRAGLYGFGNDRRRFAKHPRKTSRLAGETVNGDSANGDHFFPSGGFLQVETRSGDQYRLHRTFLPDKPGSEDQIDIQTLDGTKQGTQLLRSLVSGVDEQTFNSVFAIGLDELQQLVSLNDTEAAEMLFRLSVGLDRVAIVDTIKEISARRNKILHIAETEGKPALLTQLLTQRERVVEEIAATKSLTKQYVGLRSELRVLDRSVEHTEEDLAKQQQEQRFYEIALNTVPIWARRDKVREEIEAMGTVVVVTENVVGQLSDIEKEFSERRTAYDKLKEEYIKAKNAIAGLSINERIVQLAPRIEFLLEEESRIVDLDREITTLESEIEEYTKQIADEESRIRRGDYPLPREQRSAVGASHSDTIPAGVLEEYRTYARSASRARKRLIKTKRERAEWRHRFREHNDRLKVELAKREVNSISEAAERAGETVNQLRRRQSVGQKLNEMSLHHKELRRINAFLMQNQALPGWMLGLMILTGLAGAVFIGLGIFPPLPLGQSLNAGFVILGCLMIAGTIAGKKFSEKNNAKRLEHNQRQLAALTVQIDQVRQEVSAIDIRFPFANTSPIEVRLQDAHQELASLEKLMPIETQRNEANQQLKQIEIRLQQCKEDATSAIKRWDDWLRRAGLPSDWTPAQIRDYLAHCESCSGLKKERDRRNDTVRERNKDIKLITDRIDSLTADINMTVPDGMSYIQTLAELRKKLEENKAAGARREKLKTGIKEFRKMRSKVVADLHKAKQQETDLLRQFSVKLPEELRALHQRHQKHRRLLSQEQNIQREIDAAIGNFCSEERIASLLDKVKNPFPDTNISLEDIDETELPENQKPTLEELLQDVQQRIETTSARLHEELQSRGHLIEQLKSIAEDQTATRKQRELAILDEKIKSAQKEWQIYAVCSRMLDEIRSTYERDRQPRTLAEASEILKRLTDEKYQRIWTPLGEETLLVEDQQGNTFELSWLARGTREQLFIALRLALASEFARHGAVLPLILDDVLVNFDSRRAWSAIQVLQDAASPATASGGGRQVFVFTCHEHICQMFQKMKIPVRQLPPVDGDAKI